MEIFEIIQQKHLNYACIYCSLLWDTYTTDNVYFAMRAVNVNIYNFKRYLI